MADYDYKTNRTHALLTLARALRDGGIDNLSTDELPEEMRLYAAEILEDVAKSRAHKHPPHNSGKQPVTPKGLELLNLQMRFHYQKELQKPGDLARYLKAHYPGASPKSLKNAAADIRRGVDPQLAEI